MIARKKRLVMQSKILPPNGYKFIEYAEKLYSSNNYVDLPYEFDETDYVEVKGAIYSVVA